MPSLTLICRFGPSRHKASVPTKKRARLFSIARWLAVRALARLPTADLPRDVMPLAQAVNLALDRVERALQAQREFTRDAAHELRTPLTILRTHIDTRLEGEAAVALRFDTEAMSRIVDQLLELTLLEGLAAGREERADLYAVGPTS